VGTDNTNTEILIPEDMDKKSSDRPNIFEYQNYREFLKDWFNYLKMEHHLSIRKFSKAAGISNGFLVMVLSGKRPLSSKAFNKILPFLHLEKYEARFLEKLRLCEVASNAESKHAAVLELKNHRNYRLKNQKEVQVLEYLGHWYHIAIRELTADLDFKDDVKWIQKKLAFHVPLKNIREALKFLEESEYLIRDKKGSLRALDKKIHCTPKIWGHSLRSMHEQMLELALKSIDETDSSERMVLGSTVFVGDSQIQEIRSVLQEARDRISAIELGFEETTNEKGKVYHVELAGFPLTDAKKKRKKQ